MFYYTSILLPSPLFLVDHTRVILDDVEPGGSDYINANRIWAEDEANLSKKEYIATQVKSAADESYKLRDVILLAQHVWAESRS